MANPTYVLIQSSVLGSSQASVTFSSISSAYTDLKLVCSTRTDRNTGNASYISLQFNTDTGSNYSGKQLEGAGSGTPGSANYPAGTPSAFTIVATSQATNTASTFGSDEFYIPNYTSSNAKSVSADGVSENNATTAYADLTAGLWSGTAAINQIVITPTSGFNFVANSSFYLYGVKNA